MSYRRYDVGDDADHDLYYVSEAEHETCHRASTHSREPRTYVIIDEYYLDPKDNHDSSRSSRSHFPRIGEPSSRSSRPSASYDGENFSKDNHGSSRSSRSHFPRSGEPSSRSSRPSALYGGENFSRNGARRFASNPDVPHRYADHDYFSKDYEVPRYQPARSEYQRKPTFFCWPCNKSFASAEEKFDHQLNSRRHFLCRLCNDGVDHMRASDRELHYQDSHQLQFCHFCVKLFSTDSARYYHMDDKHSFCEPCGIHFADREDRRRHWSRSNEHLKEYCLYCKDIFPDLVAHGRRNHSRRYEGRSKEHTHRIRDYGHDSCRGKQTPREESHRSSSARHTGVHYVTLGVSPSAHQDEIVRAAKKRRIESHPDRLKRKPGLSELQKAKIDEEAAKVGHAADILSDPVSRMQYDQNVRAGREE